MIVQSHSWVCIWEKTLSGKETCSPVFTAAGFIMAKTRKQAKCPLTEEWIEKMCITQPLKKRKYRHLQQHGYN